MRVDGLSSVMTCTVPAREGMIVETQNVVGSARHDLLAAADWFFPKGMDHHHMFTWSKPVNDIMQKVARRIAGIGRIPDEVIDPSPPREIEAEVLVIGGGPAGLAAAAACARRGRRVLLVDEEARAGGHLRFLPGDVEDDARVEAPASELADRLEREARDAGVEIAAGHAAVAVYDQRNSERGDVPDAPERTVALLGASGLALSRPLRLVVATGAHEGGIDVPGNDTPGAIGVRGACRLLAHGVVPGDRVALVGDGHWATALKDALEEHDVETLGPYPVVAVRRIRGKPEVRAVEVATGDGDATERVACDAVALSGPLSGAYEIGAQAGAAVRFDGQAFFLDAGARDGATSAGWVRAVGQCAGVRALPDGLRQARAAGEGVAAELAEGGGGGRV
jgi:sarcosine oxidase subunit alpha